MRKHRNSISKQNALLMAGLAACCGLIFVSASSHAQSASSATNEMAFNDHCRECHAFDKGDNRVGPTLYGVVGRKAGTVPGYDYSQSVQTSGITWTPANLDAWIKNPDAFIPGNNMGAVFPGLSDKTERAKIIAFLKGDTKLPNGQ
jgi:cytochrome c